MKRHKGAALIEPKVVVREDTDDPEWVLGRAATLLKDLVPNPLSIEVTLPDTRRGANDSVTVTIGEGELDRKHIYLSGHVNGGLRSNDDVTLNGGCIRSDQLDRLILALQLAATEADKLGIRTPRPLPKVRVS